MDPKESTTTIDAGTQLFNLKAERTRKGLFFTAYCEGVTLRSKHLEIDRILDTFIDGMLLVCGLDDEESEATADRVEDEIRAFVDESLKTL
jgi:hypothetical protein